MKKSGSFIKTLLLQDRLYYCIISNLSLLFQFISFAFKNDVRELRSYIGLIFLILIFLLQTAYIFKPNLIILRKEANFFLLIAPSIVFHFYLTFYVNDQLEYYLEILILLYQLERLLKEFYMKLAFNTGVFIFFCVRFHYFYDELILSILYLLLFLTLFLKAMLEENMKKVKLGDKKNIQEKKMPLKGLSTFDNDSNNEHLNFHILNSFNEGVVLFDSNLKIKWKNDLLYKIIEIPLDFSNQDIEFIILNMKQEENTIYDNDHSLKQKMKQVCGAFQSKVAILNDSFFNDKVRNSKSSKSATFKSISGGKSYKSGDQKSNNKTFKSSNMSLKTKPPHKSYYLNHNGNFEVNCGEFKTNRKLLKEFLHDVFLHGPTKADDIQDITKYNMYGTMKINHKSNKKTFFVSFYPFNNEIFVCLRQLDQNDLILSLYDNHLYQSKQLASMCHELRTPLNSVTNILEMLVAENIENIGQQNDYLFQALASSKLLLGSINDFFDYFSIISNIFDLEIEETNLNKLIQEICQLFQLTSERKKLEIVIEFDEKLPTMISTDTKRLKQILFNLLANSLRFTNAGSITIGIKLKEQELIKFSIKDTGVGIEDNFLQCLANFKSGKDDKKNTTGGFGLCISNYLVNYLGPPNEIPKLGIYNGLKLKTDVGHGTTFSFLVRNYVDKDSRPHKKFSESFEIILEDTELYEKNETLVISEHFKKNEESSFKFLFSKNSDASIILPLPSSEIKKTCSCAKVLAVDDNIFNLFVLSETLKKLKINTNVANNGIEAIQIICDILQKNPNSKMNFCEKCQFYKLILMDIDMPIKNGFETTMELKNIFNNFGIDVPIVALSAFSQKEYKTKAKEVGMELYIEKPFTQEKLKMLISRYLTYNE